jgi:hypothetical protein
MQKIADCANELIAWYWEYGIQRDERYQIPRGSWLHRLHCVRNQAQRYGVYPDKPSFGLWGPSQTGKSSLLSDYIDANVNPQTGHGSSLQWQDQTPVVFEKRDCSKCRSLEAPSADDDSSAWVLNPFNQQADASSCVSRFKVGTVVKYPAYPVQLIVASRRQILHALAMGFHSECRSLSGPLDWEQVADFLDKNFSGTARPSPEAFAYLSEVVDLLKLIVRCNNYDRFNRLDKEGNFDQAATCVLTNEILSSDPAMVDRFVAWLFWDNYSSITQLYSNLLGHLAWLEDFPGEIYCDYPVATALLDMSFYSKAMNPESSLASRLGKIVCRQEGNDILLGYGGWGTPLFPNPENFGIFQGLIWEMVYTLNQQQLAASEASLPLLNFLENADLLDFPGVSNRGRQHQENLLDNEALEGPRRVDLYAAVLKRGKTASIVASSAEAGKLDGLSILLRSDGNAALANPDQIITGVKIWSEQLSGKNIADWKRRELPLNVVFTFGGSVFSNTIKNLHRPITTEIFPQALSLGFQKHQACFFTTHYHRFIPVVGDDRNGDREKAFDLIKKSPQFDHLFDDTCTLVEMLNPDRGGGTRYFFEKLANQAANTNQRRQEIFLERRVSLRDELIQLYEQESPETGIDQRTNDLKAFKENTEANLKRATRPQSFCKRMAKALRIITSVDPDILDLVPRQCARNHDEFDPEDFVRAQFRKFIGSVGQDVAGSKFAELKFNELFGFTESSQVTRFVNYLVDEVDTHEIGRWLIQEFGHLVNREERLVCRRFIAVRMTRELIVGKDRPTSYPSAKLAADRLRLHSGATTTGVGTEYTMTPEYASVIEPLLLRVKCLIAKVPAPRSPQPGDSEYTAFLSKHEPLSKQMPPATLSN